jgi:hypothetical protein
MKTLSRVLFNREGQMRPFEVGDLVVFAKNQYVVEQVFTDKIYVGNKYAATWVKPERIKTIRKHRPGNSESRAIVAETAGELRKAKNYYQLWKTDEKDWLDLTDNREANTLKRIFDNQKSILR